MFRRALLLTGVLLLSLAFAALAQEFVVQVNQGAGDQSDYLFSRVGKVKEDGSMDWGNSTKIAKGKSACVAVEGKTAVLVKRGTGDAKEDLLYQVGTVDLNTMTVAWGPEVRFNKGASPFVSFKGTRVVVVNQSPDSERLWMMVGVLEVQRQQITFGQAVKYDNGANPAIGIEVAK
jgi:hypothetical protein